MNVFLKSLLIFAGAGLAFAQSPNFDYPYLVTDAEGYIVEANEYTIPCFGDWDDDGDMDLMVGVLYDGNVFYYENVSTGVAPQFTEGEIVMADGSPITVIYA